jgi:hypothetical protein
MSYDIIYDKQFVKANDKFFPIVLVGSSNCFEVGTRTRDGRRSRSWCNDTYICNFKQYATREEIMARVEEIRQGLIDRNKKHNEEYIKEGKPEWVDHYSDDRFGYYSGIALRTANTSNTKFSDFKNLYKTGMDKALTVEQLAEEGVYVDIHTHSYNNETQDKCKELNIEFLKPAYPKTTEELLETVEKFENNYKDKGISWFIEFDNGGKYFENKIRRIRQKYFPKRRRNYTHKEVDFYYTVTEPAYGEYFAKLTSRGYRYGYSPIHRFETEKEAQRFANKYKNRINLSVVRINRTTEVKSLI